MEIKMEESMSGIGDKDLRSKKSWKVTIPILTIKKKKKMNKLKINSHLLIFNRELKSQTNLYPETWKDKQIPRITDYQGQKPLPGAGN